MPRIGSVIAAFALMASAIAFNIGRYPKVWEMFAPSPSAEQSQIAWQTQTGSESTAQFQPPPVLSPPAIMPRFTPPAQPVYSPQTSIGPVAPATIARVPASAGRPEDFQEPLAQYRRERDMASSSARPIAPTTPAVANQNNISRPLNGRPVSQDKLAAPINNVIQNTNQPAARWPAETASSPPFAEKPFAEKLFAENQPRPEPAAASDNLMKLVPVVYPNAKTNQLPGDNTVEKDASGKLLPLPSVEKPPAADAANSGPYLTADPGIAYPSTGM
jgi:hypothetical protein